MSVNKVIACRPGVMIRAFCPLPPTMTFSHRIAWASLAKRGFLRTTHCDDYTFFFLPRKRAACGFRNGGGRKGRLVTPARPGNNNVLE